MIEIVFALGILSVAVLLLVTEWIPMEVTAMLALGAVVLTGLVTPAQGLAGFSNPAVVTVWAVFILSGGLTRTGVADRIGRFVLRIGGTGEPLMITVIMVTSGLMSAIMNNVAVAALMMPVVLDIAGKTGRSPSRLLMPLAYGCLLGGLTTQIGTPPNILVTDALREAGMKSFGFFDFTPLGAVIMVSGILFMVFVGRHMLPDLSPATFSEGRVQQDHYRQYEVEKGLFHFRIASDSPFVGKTLSQARFGPILGWNILAVTRGGKVLPGPGADTRLLADDLLTVEGGRDAVEQIRERHLLELEKEKVDLGDARCTGDLGIAEVTVAPGSSLAGNTLNTLDFRNRFSVNVLAIRRGDMLGRTRLPDMALEEGDQLLLAGAREVLEQFQDTDEFTAFRFPDQDELARTYRLNERLMLMRVPEGSGLDGRTLKEARLGDVLGCRVLGILRGEVARVLPGPEDRLATGDRLLVQGNRFDFTLLEELEGMTTEPASVDSLDDLVVGEFALGEATLSPQSSLEGKTLRQINFREKFGLNVLAIWKRGRPFSSDLRDLPLRFGDVLLLYGTRHRLRQLASEPDFVVLSEPVGEELRTDKMPISLLLMAGVLLPVLFGWVSIAIAAVIGSAFMVLTGCLTMEEAYRQIEWKAVVLIAGMLPLGTALQESGAARLLAQGVVDLVGPLGPGAVMAGLLGLTFAATCFVPTAALVVLMAPIVFSACAEMNLSPQSMLMAVGMAASSSFMTPVSHPANILVMGPGGYRFSDYFKVGGLLTVVVFTVLMLVHPLLWPLSP